MQYYEGKFRDFIVGWLALQLKEPGVNVKEIESLYDAVVFAESDSAALAEVEKVLGQDARMLWGLSEGWYDTTVEMARVMIEMLRKRSMADFGAATKFYLFFLNPFKEGCVPDGFEDNLEREICWMFRVFYESAGERALVPKDWYPYVIVEPSYADASEIVFMTHPKEDPANLVFLFQSWYKAWNLRFASLIELAEALLNLSQAIEQCASKAILGYRLAKTVTEIMREIKMTLNIKKGEYNPMGDPTKFQSLREFADRVAYVVTDLNGLISNIVNEEITVADFDDDLTELTDKLNEVEGAVSELTKLFGK